MMKLQLVIIIFSSVLVSCREGFGPTNQEWGYVTVRPEAHMFWWFHESTANVHYTDRPLIIWLQGGPGASSTGYGNFAEIGPLDPDLNPRNQSWIQFANLLFVDNPVGTGFSYVENLDALTTTNKQIAEDFVVLLREILETLPELSLMSTYIFCESYGGKMATEIALTIDRAVKEGSLDVKLEGIGLGDSWISPIDTVMSWGPYLLNLGIVDQNGYEQIQNSSGEVKAAYEAGNFSDATILWQSTEILIKLLTNNVDFYNVLAPVPKTSDENMKVRALMNGPVKEALQLDHVWGFQSPFVFLSLSEDFMKPVVHIVEELLNTTDIKVAVYNGQLDFIVDTPGTIKWVDELKFNGSDLWKTTERYPIIVDEIVEGYYKKLEKLAFYWVVRAGHMVPSDNPAAMSYILKDVTQQ